MHGTRQPFQRQRVPQDLTASLIMHILNGLTHIAIRQCIGSPAMLFHQVMAETAFVDNDPVVRQVFQLMHHGWFICTMQQTMSENLDD